MSSPITAPPKSPSTTLAKTIAAKVTDNSHLKHALVELDLNLPGYINAEAYYEGTKTEEFSHPRIARALRKTKDRFKVNFVKTPVNIVADRLAISSITVKLRNNADAEADAENEDDTDPNEAPAFDADLTKIFERKVWEKCKLQRLTRELHHKASEYGDAYIFVWTDTIEEVDPDTEEVKEVSNNTPVIYYNSPKTTRVIYDPEAPDRPMFAIKKWRHFNGRQRVNLYYRNRTEHYQLKDGVKPNSKEAGDPLSWEILGEPTANPYNRIPIFHFRNELPYGRPEHFAGYGPQDAIDKISTTLVHSTEWLGFPQRYALADANSTLDGGQTGPDWDDEEEATQPADSETDELQSGPGTILKLNGINSVGTFEVGQPKAFLEPMEFYVRALAQTTTTPLRYFYPPGAHPPSGESYRAEDTPLINKVKQRQDDYGDTHSDVYAFAMEIVTDTPAEEFFVDVRWAPAASIDDALGWETVKKKIESGVPRRQALIESGYTADQVDAWLQKNNDKAELQRDVEIFSLFAAAAKNAADTAAVNGLNPEAVGIVLTEILQKFAPSGKKLPLPEKHEHEQEQEQGQPNGDGIILPPRLDIPPGGIRPDRDTTFESG